MLLTRSLHKLTARGHRAFSAYTMSSSTQSLAQAMISSNVTRCAIVKSSTGALASTHSFLNPLVSALADPATGRDYDGHEGFFIELHPPTQSLMGVALWKTARGQGCGGVRLRTYEDFGEYINDGLRLSQGMGRKSGLAGLWWGGGKGVIAVPRNESGEYTLSADERTDLLHAYGNFVTSLRGAYVGAEDVGINVDDVDTVFAKTRYTTCISPRLGGSGNPSVPTAHGIVAAMEGALHFAGMGNLEGKVVGVQGLGNVGGAMVGFLLEKGVKKVICSDIDQARVDAANALGDRVEATLVSPLAPEEDRNAILGVECDIVSPCGFGGVLSERSVPTIKAKIVCGAANNQLADPTDDYGMAANGILYVPDFVANRMGIVNCANEQYGRVGSPEDMEDPAIVRHMGREWDNSLFNVVNEVLGASRDQGCSTVEAANTMSDSKCAEQHPIWPGRTREIVQSLVADGWGREE
jgi:glutamate dehydrogenase/leucine dehydrogenase